MKQTEELERYFDMLWPVCRSITGNGLRSSFKILQEIIPLQLHEVPTGTRCFDWEVPEEWNIEDAFIITPGGDKICEFKKNNLHLVNYSIPVDREISFDELEKHLHYMQELPGAIPYVTSYYKASWGFCLSYEEYTSLSRTGVYKVVIRSTLREGSLTYGDLVLKGDSDEEVLFSTYLCHPSMANNELSGPLCLAFLYRKIAGLKNRKYTYRFVVAPETIGVIAYLARHGKHMKEATVAGYVMTCCGDPGDFTYKRSKQDTSLADAAARHVLNHQLIPFKEIPFSVGGSDERQYCSPGFNLPVGSLTRSMYQRYKEYHTSFDNKQFISFDAMLQTVETYFAFVRAMELNDRYVNTVPHCEPQLGKRGLYPSSVNPGDSRKRMHDMMHLLSFADGQLSLLEIAEKGNISIFDLAPHVERLLKEGLLKRANDRSK